MPVKRRPGPSACRRSALLRGLLVSAGAWALSVVLVSPAVAALKLEAQWGSGGAAPGQFGLASGISVRGGQVYVGDQATSTHHNPDRVQRFDFTGKFIGDWTVPFNPQQIATDETGTVYVTAGAGNPYAVQAYSASGTLLTSWTGTGTPAGRMTPDGVAAGNGRVYVADHTRVVVFTPGGRYITEFGGPGTGPGQFGDARRVALDASGNVYVYDANPPRIEKFDSSGRFLAQFGMANANGTPSTSDTYGASGLTVSPSGYLYVADFYNFRIQKFTLSGQLAAVYRCGTADTGGVACRPNDVAFDPAGNMYVIDYNSRILKFLESTTPPPPVLGKAVDVRPVSGRVFIRSPGGTTFTPLTGSAQIPVGSAIDSRAGTLQLTSATTRKNRTFTGTFGGAIFSVSQGRSRAQNGLTTLQLVDRGVSGGPTFSRCTAASRDTANARRSSRVLQLLRANAHGRFRTRGHYSAATVRGTNWDTAERCDGTLTIVHRGTVVVTDFRRHKSIIVHAGQRYLAKAR